MNHEESTEPVRVLLVEDSLPVRWRLRSLIEESGQAKVVAETGCVFEAIDLFYASPADAVVLDLYLQGEKGCVLLHEVKRTHPGCVVMVLTNFSGPGDRARCLDLGADYFFDKAAEFERVPEVLASLCSVAAGHES